MDSAQRREELLSSRAGIAFEAVISTDDKLDFIVRRLQGHDTQGDRQSQIES
jgi:hypothetical protein